MNAVEDHQAPLGHNRPPTDAELLAITLEEAAADLFARADALKQAADDPDRMTDITTPEQEQATITFQKQVMECRKQIEGARKEQKAPFDARGKQVQAYFTPVLGMLDAIKTKSQDKLNVWLKAKAAKERAAAEVERKKAEEERQKAIKAEEDAKTAADAARAHEAQEAAQEAIKAADAKTADAGVTRTDYGQTASLRTVRKYEITEPVKVPFEYWMIDEKKLAADVRGGKTEIPGVRVWTEETAVVR